MNYHNLYNSLIEKRRSLPLKKTPEVYTEVHHIIPRCLGGSDHHENLIRLSAREHFIAHRFLSKIYANNTDLALTVLMFKRVRGEKICSSREYERLKVLASIKMVPVNTKRMESQWGDLEFRKLMIKAIKDARLKDWEDPFYKKKMAEQSQDLYKEPSFVEKKTEGYMRFLNDNPWPWQRTSGVPRRLVWNLAATFWEVGRFNPENNGEGCGVVTFTKEFCGGEYQGIISKMHRMFRDGWIPKECPAYLKEFGTTM